MFTYYYDLVLSNTNLPQLRPVKRIEYHQLLDNPEHVYNFVTMAGLQDYAEEHSLLIGVNNQSRVLGSFILSHGSANMCQVGTREIFIRLLLVGAASFLVVHNHPSGECKPSTEDLLCLRKLKNAGSLMNTEILDFIIVGRCGYYSARESFNDWSTL